jgi:16S rRNA (guanine527-N7)-methyltransferase
MLSASRVTSLLESYSLQTSTALVQQVLDYTKLLLSWNRKISLTAIQDPEEIVRFHFAESMLGAKVADLRDGRLADVGSGPGFPGLAIKLYSPAVALTLIESNAKKCAFLSEVARELGLTGVAVVHSTYQVFQISKPFDAVTARALGELGALIGWARSALLPNGKLALWLGQNGVREATETAPGWKWHLPYPIPGSDRRFILLGNPPAAS